MVGDPPSLKLWGTSKRGMVGEKRKGGNGSAPHYNFRTPLHSHHVNSDVALAPAAWLMDATPAIHAT